MRASGRRRGLTISAAFPVAVATMLAVVLPLSHGAPAAAPGPAKTGAVRADGTGPIGRGDTAVVTAGGAGRLPVGRGDTVCGDVRFDKAELPGRTATPANGDWPTAAAADLLQLRGWQRAVPYDITRWTVVLNGDAGMLVVFLPGSGFHYLPIHGAAGGGWSVGPPCTPS